MHIGRKHTKTVPSATKAAGNWGGPTGSATQSVSEVRTKRVYTKRKKQIETQSVNYCPRCGCPVANVALAMTVADGMNRNGK